MIELVTDREKYFQKNEKEFLSYLHKKNGTHLTKDNLAFAFHDLDGNAYYKFPKEVGMPMARLGKVQEFATLLTKGVDGKEYNDLLAYADKALTDGIKNGKNASKIGFVLSELVDLQNIVIHDEIFYNIIAVQMVRHDESITEFSNDIHMQKVVAFRRLNQENDTFFLNTNEFLRPYNWSNITPDELRNLLLGSEQDRKAREESLRRVFGLPSQRSTPT